MRILIVAPEYPPNVVGGGGAVYEAIAEHLARQQHAVTVMCGEFGTGSRLIRRELVRGVEVISLPTIPSAEATPWLLTAMPPRPRAWATFVNQLTRRRWDVAHLHGVGFPLVDSAAWLFRRRRIPYVFTCHSVPEAPFHKGNLAALAVRTYLGFATRATISGAATVTAVSKAVASNPRFALPQRTRVIYNGLTDGAFAASPSRSPHAKFRALSAGRISRAKGFDVAIEAIAILRDRYQLSVEYDIWGADGGEESQFRALAERLGVAHLVRFRGPFAPERRAFIFGDYDVLLVPSRVEPFGLAAIEGMALGVPVVAADRDGLREVLDDAPTLVPGENAEAIAEAVARLFADPDRREHAIREGYRRADRFRWSELLPEYEACLAEAAGSILPLGGRSMRERSVAG